MMMMIEIWYLYCNDWLIDWFKLLWGYFYIIIIIIIIIILFLILFHYIFIL